MFSSLFFCMQQRAPRTRPTKQGYEKSYGTAEHANSSYIYWAHRSALPAAIPMHTALRAAVIRKNHKDRCTTSPGCTRAPELSHAARCAGAATRASDVVLALLVASSAF